MTRLAIHRYCHAVLQSRRQTRFAIATLLAATLVAACGSSGGSDGSGGSGSTPAVQPPVTGHLWVLDATRLLPAAADVTVTANFAQGRVSGTSGCNQYSVPYRANAVQGTLSIGPQLQSTLIGCPGLRGQVEQAYTAALIKVRQYEATSELLTMLDSAGKALLRFTASNGAAGIQGDWTVTTLYTGNAVQSPVAGSKLTASFDGERTGGDAGCNRFGGTYTTAGDTITIGPLVATQRACADPAVTEQEQQYLDALAMAKTFTVAGRRLDLYRADGGYAVSFTR